jgi:hypothetical protein
MKKSTILALTACSALLALTACGGGDTPAAKNMTVRQQDTSKKAGAPKAETGTMKQMDESAAPKAGAKKP